MSGRWLINGLLLALLILLGLMIRAELERAHFVPRLTDLAAADLYRVEIVRAGEPTITLIQTAIGWRLETPLQVDADNGRVSRLLGLLEAPVERSFPAQSSDLRELGLSPPRLRLRLDARELQFGDTDPIGRLRYVAGEGLVYLIQDRFHHQLIAPAIDYVSPQLIPRGFAPVFGRLDDTPLTPETLNDLVGLHAERVEKLAEIPTGAPVVLKSADGTALRFLISEDRRRWARLDQRLLYILSEAPELTLDPSAVDPTPGEPSASSAFAGADETAIAPESLVPGEELPSEPPVVRLTPDGQVIPVEVPDVEPDDAEFTLPGEPDKAAPSGFGQDPFAPDPTMYADPPAD